jgi:hypothetical protein
VRQRDTKKAKERDRGKDRRRIEGGREGYER